MLICLKKQQELLKYYTCLNRLQLITSETTCHTDHNSVWHTTVLSDPTNINDNYDDIKTIIYFHLYRILKRLARPVPSFDKLVH